MVSYLEIPDHPTALRIIGQKNDEIAALRDALAQTVAALRQIPALWYARNQGSNEWLKAVDAILTLAEDTLDAITSESH